MDANQDQKVPQPAEGAPEVYPDEQQNNNSLGNMDSVVDGTTVTEATTLLGNAQSTTVGSSVVTGTAVTNNTMGTMGTIEEGHVGQGPLVSSAVPDQEPPFHDAQEPAEELSSTGCMIANLVWGFLDIVGGILLLVCAFFWKGEGLTELLKQLEQAFDALPQWLRKLETVPTNIGNDGWCALCMANGFLFIILGLILFVAVFTKSLRTFSYILTMCALFMRILMIFLCLGGIGWIQYNLFHDYKWVGDEWSLMISQFGWMLLAADIIYVIMILLAIPGILICNRWRSHVKNAKKC